MRAAAEHNEAAALSGINDRARLGWSPGSIGTILAFVGGVVLANKTQNVNVQLADLGLLAFPAVVIGGLESIPGAVVGGLIVGVLESFSGGYISTDAPQAIVYGGAARDAARPPVRPLRAEGDRARMNARYSTSYRQQARLVRTNAMLVWVVILTAALIYLPWVIDEPLDLRPAPDAARAAEHGHDAVQLHADLHRRRARAEPAHRATRG